MLQQVSEFAWLHPDEVVGVGSTTAAAAVEEVVVAVAVVTAGVAVAVVRVAVAVGARVLCRFLQVTGKPTNDHYTLSPSLMN